MSAQHRTVSRIRPLLFTLLLCGLAALLVPGFPATAGAASGDLSWYYTDDSPLHHLDAINCAAPGPNGSMYAGFGWGDNMADKGDLGLLRLRPTRSPGPVIWQRIWDNPTEHLADSAIAVATDSGGNAIVAGQTDTVAGGRDWVVVKRRPTGKIAWVSKYSSPTGHDDWADDVACDRAGNAYVCGMTDHGAAGRDLVVVKFRARDGKRLWTRTYSGPSGSTFQNWAHALAVAPTGACYVVGESDDLTGTADLFVMKLTRTGKVAWKHRVDGAAHGADWGVGAVLHGDKLFVAGNSNGLAGTRKVMMARYTTSGRRVWLRTWKAGDGKAAQIFELAVDGYGNPVACGTVYNDTPRPGLLLSRTARGKLRWARLYRNTTLGGPSSFESVVADAAGRVWACGYTSQLGMDMHALVVRYGPTGKRAWQRVFVGDGTGDDWFNVVRLWGSRGLFVGGGTQTATGYYDLLATRYVR